MTAGNKIPEQHRSMCISVHPKFCDRIRRGNKRWEFRKTLPSMMVKGNRIIIYETAPKSKVIGFFYQGTKITGSPASVWQKLQKHDHWFDDEKESFEEYFQGAPMAVAIQIRRLHVFNPPRNLVSYGITHPPQSFCFFYDRFPAA